MRTIIIMYYKQFVIFLFVLFTAYAEAYQFAEHTLTAEGIQHTKEAKAEAKEDVIITHHTVSIDGKDVPYTATVGTQVLRDDDGNAKASIFYIAYTREGENKTDRPVTFCFNGGPGSSSVWLHLGVLGPKRVNINDDGLGVNLPYRLADNPYSLLDVTDLVFIDPISTGYSRALPPESAKQFHGVDGDIQSIAEFIRLYTTRNELWGATKFLAGESYGTARAAGLAQELHDEQCLDIDGILLISTILNFQTLSFAPGNDLSYILALPSYTATAFSHRLLAPELQRDLSATLREAEEFAQKEYAVALLLGDTLDAKSRTAIIDKLARYTGLSKNYLDLSNLRVSVYHYAQELLRGQRRTIGRFDSRVKGISSNACAEVYETDPSYDMIIGLFAAAFNDYVRADLNWKTDEEYKILVNLRPWNYGAATNQYLNIADKLRDVMNKNPSIGVYVASGLNDLATPYFATEYTLAHLGLDPSLRDNIVSKRYEGGHMMYLYQPTLVKMKDDMASFFRHRLEKKHQYSKL